MNFTSGLCFCTFLDTDNGGFDSREARVDRGGGGFDLFRESDVATIDFIAKRVEFLANGIHSLVKFGRGDVVGHGGFFSSQEFFDDGKAADANGGQDRGGGWIGERHGGEVFSV